MTRIDLNCDLGEDAGSDAELMPLVTSANIACGAHAGSPETVRRTVKLAREHSVQIGAHPGHFDRANFGRIERPLHPAEAADLVATQISAVAAEAGPALRHVKLHGALYNQVSRSPDLSKAIADRLARDWPQLSVYALYGSVFSTTCRRHGLAVAEEAFADRTYRPDGSLTPRSAPHALITDEDQAVEQALRMVLSNTARTVDGGIFTLRPDTLCLHGDGPQAVAFARRLRAALISAGVTLSPFSP